MGGKRSAVGTQQPRVASIFAKALAWMTLGLVVGACAEPVPPPVLEYRIRLLSEDTPSLEVTLVFKGEDDGHTSLRLPDRWAGESELYNAIRDLRTYTFGSEVQRTADPGLLEVRHEPGVDVTIRYNVVQDWEGEVRRDVYHRAIVQAEYFHAVGHTFLVHPELPWAAPVEARVTWTGRVDYSFASSLGDQSNQRSVLPLEDLVRTVFVGGDYRIRAFTVEGRAVHTAVRGDWPFTDDSFADLLGTIVKMERDFWEDHDYPYYLVALTPAESGIGGTGLTNSFTTFADPRTPLDEEYPYLLTHELFHNWNGGRIRAAKDPERQYWFTEGITDFYTYELLRRSGVWSTDEYVAAVNHAADEYHRLPVRNPGREMVAELYWSDSGIRRIPYLRGHLIALWINARIRKTSGGSNSLDDVVTRVLARMEHEGELSDEVVQAALDRHLPAEDVERVFRFLDGGEIPPLSADSGAPCWTTETVEKPVFTLGFDFDATRTTGRFTGVDSTGPAYRAGIRDGMRARGWSVRFGETAENVMVRVEEAGEQRRVEYLPTGAETLVIPEVRVSGACEAY